MDKTGTRVRIQAQAMPLRGDDIDTDRIIPARYLRCVTFDGLGEYAFYDERFQGDQEKDHPFNDAGYRGAEILVVNKNFGCGSSREHAPQALMRAGIRAFIGESFSEIFTGNCTALGLPVVTAPKDTVDRLMDQIEREPTAQRLYLVPHRRSGDAVLRHLHDHHSGPGHLARRWRRRPGLARGGTL